jgi:hypothetical protein
LYSQKKTSLKEFSSKGLVFTLLLLLLLLLSKGH